MVAQARPAPTLETQNHHTEAYNLFQVVTFLIAETQTTRVLLILQRSDPKEIISEGLGWEAMLNKYYV